MNTILDQIFWWVGAMVSAVGAVMLSVALFIGLGYLAYQIVLNYRIACLVECHPLKAFDCGAYRMFYRFKYAVRFFFSGVPTELCLQGHGVIFHIDWIKGGRPDDLEGGA